MLNVQPRFKFMNGPKSRLRLMDGALPDDLDLLLALEVFLRERHVTRAAKRLGITQSAASQRLGRLRIFFGDSLLAPGRPLLSLTPRAHAMLGPLSAAIANLRAAIQAGAPFDPKTSERRFLLLGNDMVEAAGLPILLPLIEHQAPRVTLRVERGDPQFASRLENGNADLAFVPQFLVVPSLVQLRLPEEPFVTLMRSGHPALSRKLSLELRRSVGVRGVKAPLELGPDQSSIVWHPRSNDDAGHRGCATSLPALLARRRRACGVQRFNRLERAQKVVVQGQLMLSFVIARLMACAEGACYSHGGMASPKPVPQSSHWVTASHSNGIPATVEKVSHGGYVVSE